MLLLILQIGFGVRAWRTGWRGRALIPAAIGYAVAFLLGVAAGMAGATSVANLAPLFLLIDAGVAAATAVMAFRRPRPGHPSAPAVAERHAVAAESESLAA